MFLSIGQPRKQGRHPERNDQSSFVAGQKVGAGEHRSQSPTLDLIGIKAPAEIGGIQQQPIEGTSLAYSIDDAKAPSQHTVQYYYIFGSRSIYDHGWKAELAYPSSFITGNFASKQPFDENAWELYNLNEDYTGRIDLAKTPPEKLAEMKLEFEAQAKAHNLYPTSRGTTYRTDEFITTKTRRRSRTP